MGNIIHPTRGSNPRTGHKTKKVITVKLPLASLLVLVQYNYIHVHVATRKRPCKATLYNEAFKRDEVADTVAMFIHGV